MTDQQDPRYDIQMAPLFEGLQAIDVESAKQLSDHPWFNRTLCRVNDSLVRLGVFEGEFHWHAHEAEDEFFFVVDGELHIDIEGRDTVSLSAGQGVLVPKGVPHRPRAPGGATVLMIERDGIVPTGDT